MRSYRREVVTHLSPREAWSYLADFTTTNEWDPRASHSTRVSGDGSVGTRYETSVHFLGRTTQMTYTVTELLPHDRIEWVGENSVVRAHDVIEVRPHPQGAVVDYTSSYDYRVAAPLMDRLMSRPLERLCDDAQAGLGRALDERAA